MTREQNFWSRRKAGVAAEAEADLAAVEAQEIAEEHKALEEKTDEELLIEFDLPDPDTLKMGDDFTAFMSKAVPDRLRRRALRALWRTNPVLANVDMLVDYGEDFTDKALVVENLQTAYQVGKGMLKHVEEMARQAAERENPTEPKLEDVEDEDVEEDVLLADVEEETQIVEIAEFEPEEDPVFEAPSPRRMTFRIEETV